MSAQSKEETFESQRALFQKLEKQLLLLRSDEAVSSAELLDDRKASLAKLKQRLEATTEARRRVLKRYDEEIERRKGLISQLEKEIGESKKSSGRKAKKKG